ncbi:MAG: hypothetical protein CBC33_009385 [Coraliomargarita sp. TMED73]|jgi:hypothetical protein|nr:MAG: hypothetical protein CBC33_009385 [Coraliomargarita sp. TMED73]
MSLFQATLYTGIFLALLGLPFLWKGSATEGWVRAFPRSKKAALLLMGSATAWFLYHVWHLGPADFGQYRHLLFALFLVAAVGSFYFVPDFLAVRGLAALILLTAGVLLDAAYMQEASSRLFLVGFVYAAIVLALVLGASPYKLRDFFSWLYHSQMRSRIMGVLFSLYGLFLVGVAISY